MGGDPIDLLGATGGDLVDLLGGGARMGGDLVDLLGGQGPSRSTRWAGT